MTPGPRQRIQRLPWGGPLKAGPSAGGPFSVAARAMPGGGRGWLPGAEPSPASATIETMESPANHGRRRDGRNSKPRDYPEACRSKPPYATAAASSGKASGGATVALSKVQSVDQRMRLECGVGFRQLRTCRRTRPGQLRADFVAEVGDYYARGLPRFVDTSSYYAAFGER